MKILDSNIIIYATQSAYAYLFPLLKDPNNYISEITKLEVLGFHGFDKTSKQAIKLHGGYFQKTVFENRAKASKY